LRLRRMACCSGPTVFPPTAALVPPGNCQFGSEWAGCALLAKRVESQNTRVFTFALPDRSKPLGLSTCACVLARGSSAAAGPEPFVRPYTPISTNAQVGSFDLLVKIYPDGKMSQYLDHLALGDTIEFKHIEPNVKIQYPFNHKHVGVLVGGTGARARAPARPASEWRRRRANPPERPGHVRSGRCLPTSLALAVLERFAFLRPQLRPREAPPFPQLDSRVRPPATRVHCRLS
jgi:hypothetical protein